MDGVTVKSTTLGSVLLASASAAGSAVYKVMFKKLIGCVEFNQVQLNFFAYNHNVQNVYTCMSVLNSFHELSAVGISPTLEH